MPSFNLLAPYGSTRIPPPSTGSVAPSQYYQPGSQSSAPAGTGFRSRQASTSLSTKLSSNEQPEASGIRLADSSEASFKATSANQPSTNVVATTLVPANTVVNSTGPIQIADSRQPRDLPANIRGMHINEVRDEPAQFFPTVQAIDITQLPPATRSVNVVPVNQAIGTSVAQASYNTRSSSQSTSANAGGWHPRE